VDWKDLDRLRNPGFSFGRRGYDRHEVDRFLEQLVDWLETDAARDLGHVAITRKLELVGKSTTHVLLAAEKEAEELLRQAEADIAELRKQADADAEGVRKAADDYAQKARKDANAEASETIEEGLRRRALIDEEIKELDARRDAALERMEQLRAELAATMEGHRPPATSETPANEAPANGAKAGDGSAPRA
jgi:DivIVA domain-containing protein